MAPDHVAHPNPCPSPNIPPLRIEIEDIPIAKNHAQYSRAVAAVTAYWQQATNMALSDQEEYRSLLVSLAFLVPKSAEFTPSQHKLYRAIKAHSTWARYVMFNSIYGKVKSIADHVKLVHGSDVMNNLFDKYCKHHPWPDNSKKRRRDSVAEGQPPEKKHAEAFTSSNEVIDLSGQLAISNKLVEPKKLAQPQAPKTVPQPTGASQALKSDGRNPALLKRSKTPLVALSAVKPLPRKAAEADKMDEILRELGRIRENQDKISINQLQIQESQVQISELQVKEAEMMEKTVAKMHGSIAEFICRFKVVEENVQSLIRRNP